jgi:hypothetical protein
MDLTPVLSELTATRLVLAAAVLLGRILLLRAALGSRSATAGTTGDPTRPETAAERIIAGVVTVAQLAGAALAVLQQLHDAGIVGLW